MVSVQFQIVPYSSLHFSRSIGPFQCSRCQLQGFNLLHLSLPKWFPLFILTSVCKSLRCLISALTPGAEGGHLFRLICSVVLWGGRNTANKYHWHVWGVLTVYEPQWVCPSSWSWSTLLRLQVALQGSYLEWALGCMHFPGLSWPGSGSQVLDKSADLVAPAFCALPSQV